MNVQYEVKSADGSVKSLWHIAPGISVESVRFALGSRSHICISCQAGCNLGCRFCETGRQKNMHDLSPEEIVMQVSSTSGEGGYYDVVQFAGMGEPLLNPVAVAQATRYLLEHGLAREVTLTTAGIVPEIAALQHLGLSRLNISLHASDDETRSRIVPINRKYPIAQLLDAVGALHDACAIPVTFNYLLFDGVNDSDADLERLALLLRQDGRRYGIRLKAWNPIEHADLFPAARSRFEHFQSVLRSEGYDVVLCESMGSDVGAGCGQLRSLERTVVQRKRVAVPAAAQTR